MIIDETIRFDYVTWDDHDSSSHDEYDQSTVETLIEELNGNLTFDQSLYYSHILFSENSSLDERSRILRELRNSLDVRGVRPEITEMSSSDTIADLLIVTTISPNLIANSLEQEWVDRIELWEADPETLDIEVIEPSEDGSRDGTAEFDRIREEYVGACQSDNEPVFGEPEHVHFSEDEVGFDELLMSVADGGKNVADSDRTNDPESDTLVSALVAELDTSTADCDDVMTLCEYFGQTQSPTSIEIQLKHVQSRVETFDAYVDALEEFLDGRGTARDILDEMRSDISEIRDELLMAAEERDTIQTRVEALESDVPSSGVVSAEIERIEQSIATVDDEYRRETEQISARLDSVQEAFEEQKQWQQQLRMAFNYDESETGE
ncbi:hypothetical protein [Halomontanus rarus]|uniref:hypothetical protein n=1 Tax=Halomontanus rarus TaxID=3034020 RepID=UPI0023E8764A|nr:hypothetical protein [Halovivax sp. TS33]